MAALQVQADPIEVIVDLVGAVESTMDRAAIEEVAAAVAGGRAKRRRLAQALQDNPTVLIDGRSPALRGVGDLLIALRNAGATRVSPPKCAECGKSLRTLQRRGEDWYCGPCAAPQRKQRAAPAAARWRSSPLAIGEASLDASSVPTRTAGTRWPCSWRSSANWSRRCPRRLSPPP